MGESGLARSLPNFNLRITLVDGVNATTAVLTGIATEDTILSVLHLSTKAAIATCADITDDVTISAADQITVGSDYSSDQMVVSWVDVSV